MRSPEELRGVIARATVVLGGSPWTVEEQGDADLAISKAVAELLVHCENLSRDLAAANRELNYLKRGPRYDSQGSTH